MNVNCFALVLCFAVVLSTRLTAALGGFEMELLMTKLDYLQDRLQDVEETMKRSMESSLKEMEQRLQEKLTKHENNINEKIELVGTKFETKMRAVEHSLKKSVKTSEENTQTKLEEAKNQMISKMDIIQQQLTTETKTIQKDTQTDLMEFGEYRKSLDLLTDSVRNMSTLSENSKKILEAQFINPVRSCRQVMKISSRYIIHAEENSKPFEVFCEQNKFDGGWTVIQHRFDGSVDFYRNWTEYRNGFGSLDGEFWLGLEYVHQLTKTRPHELLVEMKDFHGNYGYAKYDEFEIGNETELYELKKLGTHSGAVGDSMGYHKNQKFTTFDRDNDQHRGNCAEQYHGAWWYRQCHSAHLNGLYQTTTDDWSAMVWYHFKNDTHGLSYSRMMIRDITN